MNFSISVGACEKAVYLPHTCIDLLGPDRCMIESNFPDDRVSHSYTVLWNAFKRLKELGVENTPLKRAVADLTDC